MVVVESVVVVVFVVANVVGAVVDGWVVVESVLISVGDVEVSVSFVLFVCVAVAV